MHSVELAVQSIKDVVAKIGEDFTKPDDDWHGMVILTTEEGHTLMPMTFSNDDEKQIFANLMVPFAIFQVKPLLVCEVVSAWGVQYDKESYTDNEPMPSQHPRRTEMVMIFAITSDRVEMHSAKIIRSKTKPPRLSKWELWPTGEKLTGQMVEPVQSALRQLEDEE